MNLLTKGLIAAMAVISMLCGCGSSVKNWNFISNYLTSSAEGTDRNKSVRDLQDIIKQGKLVAVADFNTTSYFIYKGEPMGYQYDMLRDFASFLGVKLELIAENDIDKVSNLLLSGRVDVIASNLTITAERKALYNFTKPIGTTRLVLIQRTDSPSDSSLLLENILELGGKIVYVQRSSASAIRLKNLAEEIGDEIKVVELPDVDADQLIDLVASGEIDYSVCDENVARVKGAAAANIDYSLPVSFQQNIAWAVNTKSPDLLNSLNQWLEGYLPTAHYQYIEHKYYKSITQVRKLNSDYLYVNKGEISQWDEYFKKSSEKINWDWRLLASLVYQESRFNTNAVSKRGATGLMQFMPETADYFGLEEGDSPEEQIKAGIKYLNMLDKKMEKSNVPLEERTKFVLAAYNAGYGHIVDARNLAIKYGKNPNVWDDNVEYFILHKSEYVNDTVVKYGSLRGVETYQYVNEIIDRYEHYKNLLRK